MFVASTALRISHTNTDVRRCSLFMPSCLPRRVSPAFIRTRLVVQASVSAAQTSGVGRVVRGVSEGVITAFPLLALGAAAVALRAPELFAGVGAREVQLALAALMLTTGLGLSGAELREASQRPVVLFGGLIACYVLMPALALLLATVFGLTGPLRAGLLLLGFVSGGQASNLCTGIARGDVAMSVAMTTSSTLLAAAVMPALSQLLLGAVVPVDARGLAISTATIVLAPVLFGALLSKFTKGVRPALPVIGIALVLVLIGGPVAATASIVPTALASLAAPVALLHILGGIIGYTISKVIGGSERVARAFAFETAFKSPALSFVLAQKHFASPEVSLASVVSIIVLAPLAALFAVVLRMFPPREEKIIDAPALRITKKTVVQEPDLTVERREAERAASNVGGVNSAGFDESTKFRIILRNKPPVIVNYTGLAAKLTVLRKRGSYIVNVERL